MKNALFATTALVALGVAGAATANEPLTASVSGYMNMGVGITDNAAGDDIFLQRDGEFHLKFKGVSDNGLTFDGRIELEAFGTGDYIDENWVRVSGSFGAIMIGGNDTAKNNMATGIFYAPHAQMGYYDHISVLGYGADYMGISQAGDQIGIHYTTPDISGFQASVSYQPESSSDGGNDNMFAVQTDTGDDNVFSIGANYGGDFDGFSFRISAGYETTDASDSDTWSVGAQAGASGFMLGVYYEENAGDTSEVAIGGTYSTGPWTAGLGTSIGIDMANDPIMVGGWVTYALAPGASVTGAIEHRDSDADDRTMGKVYLALSF